MIAIKKRVVLLIIIFFVISIPTRNALAHTEPIIVSLFGGSIQLEIGSIQGLPIAVHDDKTTGIYALQANGTSISTGNWGAATPYQDGYWIDIWGYFNASKLSTSLVNYVIQDSDSNVVESNYLLFLHRFYVIFNNLHRSFYI